VVPATDPDWVNGSPAPLTYTASGLPVGARLESGTGVFTWTAAENQDGSHRVTFSVSDGTVMLSETIVITVSEVNKGPVFTPIGDKSVTQGSPLSFTISATDPDLVKGVAQKLKYSVAKLPTGATFNTTSRTFSWTPKAAGVYRVSFIVTDGTIKTSETITITVIARNPIAPATATRDGVASHGAVDTAIAMLTVASTRLPGRSELLSDLLGRLLTPLR
jgi:PKD repeat protein